MTARIAAVAWDIDGTLIDSEPLHHRCLVETCLGYGLDLRRDPAGRFLGVHMHDVWTELADALPNELREEEWLDAIEHLYCVNASDAVPMTGAPEVVGALAGAGLRQVAVSNSTRRIVDANLAALGLTDMLEASVSFDDVASGKPDPEPYLRGADLLGIPADRILAVEDSPTGARSALAAGMRVAALGAAQGVRGATALGDLRDLPAIAGVMPPTAAR